VRPGRGRPGAARLGLALWLGLSVLFVAVGPPVGVIVLLVLGAYLVGPLWVPVSYRVDDAGVTRGTPFGSQVHAWNALGAYGVDPRERTAWIARKGRGTARFLPPLLLLWEDGEGDDFRARLDRALGARLAR
jgi:hypothetical protein